MSLINASQSESWLKQMEIASVSTRRLIVARNLTDFPRTYSRLEERCIL